MKLQTRYNRAIIAPAIFVLILGSVGYYLLLRYVLIKQVDDSLKVEEEEIVDYIRNHNRLPEETHYRDQQIQFIPSAKKEKRRFTTEAGRDEKNRVANSSRQLMFPVVVNGQNYVAKVSKSRGEAEELLVLILSVTGAAILLLLLFLYISNRIMLRKIWRPFYTSLATMKQFNVTHPGQISWEKSEIDEFNDLNTALGEMTRKVTQDYLSLKTFADNASHEMQTPLAVINTKLDLMIQDRELTEKNMQHLQSIYDSIGKLTRLNQSLLLIAKIENHQFDNTQKLRIDTLLNQRLLNLEELINTRQLSVTTSLRECEISMNPMLADILVSNLLSNAIRHNIPSGNINVEASGNYFAISNTSSEAGLESENIFNRFQKGTASDGLGVGLAIAKQICDLYNFEIKYYFDKTTHVFQVIF